MMYFNEEGKDPRKKALIPEGRGGEKDTDKYKYKSKQMLSV